MGRQIRVVATLVVIGYADQGLAEDARKSVQELEDELTIETDQVASIARDVEGRYHAHISHNAASVSGGVDWGGFWATLFGLLFFLAAARPALGAGIPALRSLLCDSGIDQAFQDHVREQVKPGMSAVFMMIEIATPNKAVDELAHYGGRMIQASLSDTEFARLREALRTIPADRPTSATIKASSQRD